MAPSPTSTIRVYVHWSEPTVFAGEDVACQIIFKNVAAVPGAPEVTATSKPAIPSLPASTSNRKPVNAAQIAEVRGRKSNASIPAQAARGYGHRSTISLNVPVKIPGQEPATNNDFVSEAGSKAQGHSHRRSVSIISLGTSEAGGGASINGSVGGDSPRVPFKKHGRSTSLQIVPRRGHAGGSGPPSASISHRSTTQLSPLFQNHSSTDISSTPAFLASPVIQENHSDSSAVGGSLTTLDVRNDRRKGRSSPSHQAQQGFRFPNTTFKFPASPPGQSGNLLPAKQASQETSQNNASHGSSSSPSNGRLSPRTPIDGNEKSAASLSTRILSPVSTTDTPRSSGEFYSVSNHSNETLASEYIPQRSGLLGQRPPHTRRASHLSMVSQYRPSTETLMMGYAQLQGSFTVDGSLIDQEPFEAVKRKGVTGGQGGGVIGVKKKRESGLLRGFGWGNITESLGGFLGGGELSSIKEMRTMANSRTIPLLSTPQSILFVDLKLAPGESKAFEYSFKLPRGLPPSHRGKAIKISYQLVLGTQRPGGMKEQQIKSVEVPFRVLGSVNEHGELLGHDLMSPYIVLRDQASVKAVSAHKSTQSISRKEKLSVLTDKKKDSTLEDFQSYVDNLLATPNQSSGLALLTPGAPQRRHSSVPEPTSAKEAIDMAIMRSNMATDMQQSANRFEIARGGQRVAVIMLARPAYRLGETITAVIEFANAEIACYAVHMSLESSEKVDQSLALRSDASINRVTRKVHASHSESTLFARRIVFSPSIPVGSTPSFLTSGVSLDWKIVIEFVTPRTDRTAERNTVQDMELLEEVSRDDRGTHLAAAEVLNCESFEIAVPLRVYGALAGSSDKEEAPEGLKI